MTAYDARDERAHVEPSADLRLTAAFLYQLFVACLQAGFNEDQALAIVGGALRDAMISDPDQRPTVEE